MYKESTSQLLPWLVIGGAALLVAAGLYYVFQPFVPQAGNLAAEDPAAIAR
jgi:hypothetical protein